MDHVPFFVGVVRSAKTDHL